MTEYICRENVLDNSNIITVQTKEYGSIEVIPVDTIADIELADVQPVNQLISVEDRLPDESCKCHGVVDGEVTEVGYSSKQKEDINMNAFEKFLVDRTFNEICHDYYANFQCGHKCPFYNNSFTDQCDCGAATYAQKYEMLKQYFEENCSNMYKERP